MAKHYYAGVESRFGFLTFIAWVLYIAGGILVFMGIFLMGAGRAGSSDPENMVSAMAAFWAMAGMASCLGSAIFFFGLGGIIQVAVALEHNQREQIEYTRLMIEAMPDPEPKGQKEKALV